MTVYLDPDVAYLLGLIVGRGQITMSENETAISINFPFKKPEVEGFDQFTGFTKSVYKVRKRIENLVEGDVDVQENEEAGEVRLNLSFRRRPISLRNIQLLLQGKKSHYEFSIPDEIHNHEDLDVVGEFLKGYADTAGNIRRANRDQAGRHRVYLDVLNSNWSLPVQLCRLLQDRASVPVQNILWGHPNLRDPKAQGGSEAWSREHQLRIYAEDFQKVGFYVSHKKKVLKILSAENERNFPTRAPHFCNPAKGGKRYREGEKKKHPGENAKTLPPELKGKHYNAYWEICAAMGCLKAIKGLENLRRQGRLFFTDVE